MKLSWANWLVIYFKCFFTRTSKFYGCLSNLIFFRHRGNLPDCCLMYKSKEMKKLTTTSKYNFIAMCITKNLNQLTSATVKHLLLAIIISSALSVQAQQVKNRKINIGLIYPISTNGTHAGLDTNVFSLNALIGFSAAEKGVTIAGLSSVIRQNAEGTQIAGFSNHVGGKIEGVTLAGFLNTYGSGDGIAIAGFANISKNYSGTQVAGFINIAKKVKGAQISGFINIADSSDYPIGIINIIKNGEMSIAFTTNQHLTTLATFRSGGKVLYGIIGAGYNFKNKNQVYAVELGFGAHFFQSEYFRLNAEITGSSLYDKNFNAENYFKTSLQLMPSLRIGRYIDIFAGPSLNLVSTNSVEGKELQKKYLKSWTDNTRLNGLFAGYTCGLAINF